jgi:hypothetical protein
MAGLPNPVMAGLVPAISRRVRYARGIGQGPIFRATAENSTDSVVLLPLI